MRETLATILWEGWTALVLCAAAVFLPGSEALTYPAVLWPGLVLAAAVPTGWAFWALAEQPAPLPPEQQIRHDFRKAFDPEESTLDRLYSLRRSFKEVRGLPADRRHRIMVEALAGAMDSTLQDFAQLPQDQKQERAELLRKDAERTLAYFRKLPQEKQRKAVAVLMNTEEGRAKFNQAVNTTTNILSPGDRELLGPTIKIWKNMLENTR